VPPSEELPQVVGEAPRDDPAWIASRGREATEGGPPPARDTPVQELEVRHEGAPLARKEGSSAMVGMGPVAGSASTVLRSRPMRYLHTMLRVRDLDAALDFFCDKLGLQETRRRDSDKGQFTLVFLSTGAEGDPAEIELTHNWDDEVPTTGRFFGHLAFEVDDIYATCQRLKDSGVTINRPPRDGRMAFVKSPDGHSVELLQKGNALEAREPWASMGNEGSW